jgi:hypothetical protein
MQDDEVSAVNEGQNPYIYWDLNSAMIAEPAREIKSRAIRPPLLYPAPPRSNRRWRHHS